MKNLITFLLYCLSVTAMLAQAQSSSQLEIVSKTPTETVLRLKLSGVERTEVQTPSGPAYVINIGNGTQLLEKGAPDVPKIAASLMIPRNGNMQVDIIESTYEDVPNILVAPSKGDLKRNIDPATVPYKYGDVYQEDKFYPEQNASLQTPFILRDVRGQALWITPVQYNPVSKVMRVYKEITLRVYNTGGTGENELKPHNFKGYSRTYMDVYKKLFLNFEASWLERGPETPEKMLVIANDAFLSELEPLITWKRQSGIHTTVVSMSEVGANNADNVYNFVKEYYNNEGITYLLLVGDQNAIDPQMRNSGGTPYSCDNCFGYMDGTDHYPEVLVGRFNATTLNHLQTMIARNLEYEITPLVDTDLNWCATGMASASNEGQGIGDDNQADYEQGNEWKSKHLADGYEKYWEFYDGTHGSISPTPGDESADQPGNPQNTSLVTLMNTRGVSIYNYTGHGWEQGLVSGNFNTTAVSNLRNHHRYPIVIAVACCAGNYTNNGGGDCLGEAIQRAGDPVTGEAWGSIGGFFSSDYQSWAPPMEGQDGMNQYLLDADGVTLRPVISGMAAFGNSLMIAAYQQGGEVMADFWNPFHEPTLVPRTKLPQPLAMSYLPTVFLGTSTLSVSCDVEGALVSLYWEGQTLAVGIVENGVAILNFPSLTNVGDLTVTVTQFNHIPQQGIIKVEPAGGPYVITEAISIDDAAGNNNQKADFGENILINLDLANIGVVSATGTLVTLSTTDDNVVITDNEEIVGDLADSAQVSLPAAFAFTVNSDVVDGHTVAFTIHLAFSDTFSLELPLNVQLNAPELDVTGIQIDDSAGGNNNKRFDSGETVTVTITNLNQGASNSPDALGTLTSASPYLSISAPVQLGVIDALTGSIAAQFTITVAPDAPPVTSAMLQYQVGAGNYQAAKEFGPYLINAIIEDFESNTFTDFPWAMPGNKPWIISYTDPYEGLSCARSGSITHTQKTQLQLTIDVTVPGDVSFARKVASELNFDKLKFFIDGELKDQWSGLLPWAEVSYPVEAGVHTLLWSYEKDNYGSDNGDRAWVDGISLPPHQNVVGIKNPTQLALDLSVTPNPAHDQAYLNFELPREQTLNIEVLDLLGRKVQTIQNTARYASGSHRIAFDMSRLTAGIYLVRLQGNEGVSAVKIVKE